MGVVGPEKQLCMCNKECKEFLKIVELKDTGLVVYCHNTRVKDVLEDELDENTVKISQDVFILHNTKDETIITSDVLPQLDKNCLSCPRCRKKIEHAQELLGKVSSIDRNNIIGVCDHCHKKAQSSQKPCYTCQEIVKKFIISKDQQTEDTKKYIKIWLSKIGHLLRGAMSAEKLKKVRTRIYSDEQIDLLCQKSDKSKRELEVKQMFLETHRSDINLYKETSEDKRGSINEEALIQPTQLKEVPVADVPFDVVEKIPSPFWIEPDARFVEPRAGVKTLKSSLKNSVDHREKLETFKYYEDSITGAKEAMKKRLDLSLRYMLKSKKDSEAPQSISKRSDIFEIPKISLQDIPPQITTEGVVKSTQTNRDEWDYESMSTINLQYKTSKTSQKNVQEPQRKIGHLQHILDEHVKAVSRNESIPKKVIKLEDHFLSGEEVKLLQSAAKFSHETEKPGPQEMKTQPEKTLEPQDSVEHLLKKNFSYFFPTTMEKEDGIDLKSRSSELISITEKKMRQKSENDKKKRQEELRQKLEETERRKIAREEKKRQEEEKKRLLLEEENKRREEERKQQKASEDKQKIDTEKRDLVSDTELVLKDETKRGKKELVKSNKDLKSEKAEKTEMSKKASEVKDKAAMEKSKKTTKEKHDLKDKAEMAIEKGGQDRKDKPKLIDKADVMEKARQDRKAKLESKEKTDELKEKGTKDLKGKPEPKDKSDKGTKDLKSKLEPKDGAERDTKNLKGKPEPKDKSEKGIKDSRAKLESKNQHEKAKDLSKPEQIEKSNMDGQKHKTSKHGQTDIGNEMSKAQKQVVKIKHDELDLQRISGIRPIYYPIRPNTKYLDTFTPDTE